MDGWVLGAGEQHKNRQLVEETEASTLQILHIALVSDMVVRKMKWEPRCLICGDFLQNKMYSWHLLSFLILFKYN